MTRAVRARALALMPVFLLLIPAPAQTALIELDLFALGDGLVTRDTATGTDWLDVTATQGLSYDDVVAGSFYADGWVHATVPQWCDMVGGLGVTADWLIGTGGGTTSSSSCGAPPPPETGSSAFVNTDDQSLG